MLLEFSCNDNSIIMRWVLMCLLSKPGTTKHSSMMFRLGEQGWLHHGEYLDAAWQFARGRCEVAGTLEKGSELH